MRLTLAVDFGSTFTKIAAFDLQKEELVASVEAVTTTDSDINVGLEQAISQLEKTIPGRKYQFDEILSCSSAAGGLKMVAIGLTTSLTTRAANEASLGAGAKLISSFSHRLSLPDIKSIERLAPDLVLLAGGTDGGDKKNIIANARALAKSRLDSPIIIAGNKLAVPETLKIMKKAGKYAVSVENILPELDHLNIEPARDAIRDIFIKRIIQAKGLDKAQKIVGKTIIPTPMAVLNGANLLSRGIGEEEGWGELMLIDVGGATTDVHSIGFGYPSQPDVILKGLREPFAKRTVEGDMGIRFNAPTILMKSGESEIRTKLSSYDNTISINDIELSSYTDLLSRNVAHIARNQAESLIDKILASLAVETAVLRHVGKIEEHYFPTGKIKIQSGKDLTACQTVIGTGGIFRNIENPRSILKSALFDPARPEFLCPVSPQFFLDEKYILFAVGLLSEVAPQKSIRILKRYLSRIKN